MKIGLSKPLLKHSGIYLFFDIFNKSIPFLFLPYLAHMLTIKELGMLELFNTYVALLTLLILFGLDGWCSSTFYSLQKKEFSKRLILGLKISFSLCLMSTFILFLLHKSWWVVLSPVYAFSMGMIQIRALIFRLQFRTIAASSLLFLNIACGVCITLWVFSFVGPEFSGRIFALILPSIIISCMAVCSILREFDNNVTLSSEEFFGFIKFTIPLIPNGLINFIRFGADRFFVAHFMGVTNLALFGVSYQFSMVANIFMLSLNQAFMPFTIRLLNEYRLREFFKMVVFIFVIYSFFLTVLYISTPMLLQFFFDKKYQVAQYISRSYYLAYPFILLSILLMNFAFIRGRTTSILLITMVSSLLHLCVLCYLLMHDAPLEYIPNALLISSFCSLGLSFFLFVRLARDGE
ncbi:oligosaccharide flippase family protein [Escherichia albertii]|uniref:Putative O-antigen transporter n=2 Tax=Escherichia albertii TaxID=208962 RepID=A0A5A4U8B5_ESCAL|nr:oligosaccharide flippase family protein [Escherichia albertii]MCZ8641288.1 oligosaccharide flippase family protein [Escherichia albertii]MCZ9211463.1 oligosaccharide flippase family protein [Escherichia albertii]WKU77691.1 oligosaccharide flippase family protein [Escherichia albertii]BBM62870.1 predicted O-antigen flippase [Escherichia albertii]